MVTLYIYLNSYCTVKIFDTYEIKEGISVSPKTLDWIDVDPYLHVLSPSKCNSHRPRLLFRNAIKFIKFKGFSTFQ